MANPSPRQPRITTPYGKKGSAWSSGYHTGADFAQPAGNPVVAARPGVVEDHAGSHSWAGRNLVIVNVGGGQRDWYAHMRSKSVSVGQQVQAGQKLGEVGTLGNSTGNHLHFEVRINGRATNPSNAIAWKNGMVLPPPDDDSGSSPGSGTGNTANKGPDGGVSGGNFELAADLIDIDELRAKTLFNPPMYDGMRLVRLYESQSPTTAEDWWKLIHGDQGMGRGWIIRDPAALEGVGGLHEKDYYEGPVDPDTGEIEPLAPDTIRDPVISIDNYRGGTSYGFRFLMNPGSNVETYQTAVGVDVGQFLADVATMDAPPVIQHTGVGMQVSLLLDRQMDHKMFAQYGMESRPPLVGPEWTTRKYGGRRAELRREDMDGIRKYGTMWDLEYLFRCVNGNPPNIRLWTGKQNTSDFGVLVPYPIIVSIGDGPKTRRIRGSIMSATFKHTMFAPGMVPVRTQVSLNISRHSDAWYTNENVEGESQEDTSSGSTSSSPNTGLSGKYTPGWTPGVGTTAATNQTIAEPMARGYGWTGDEWKALQTLWYLESTWNHRAHNKKSSTYNGSLGSGAYGIPQSMPGTKMRSEGSDWLTNPKTQIRWGLKYIKGRYKTPSAALAFHKQHGWY